MRSAKLLAAVAALSLVSTQVVAAAPKQADSATKLSLSKARAGTKAKKSNELAPAILIGVLATVAIIGGAVVIADSDDEPDSP